MSRTHKQPYRKSRRFDSSCRCHGSCGYCRDNRISDRIRADRWLRAELAEAAQDCAWMLLRARTVTKSTGLR